MFQRMHVQPACMYIHAFVRKKIHVHFTDEIREQYLIKYGVQILSYNVRTAEQATAWQVA